MYIYIIYIIYYIFASLPIYILQEQLPAYLKALPIPNSFSDFLHLSREEKLELLPLCLFLAILVYLVISSFRSRKLHHHELCQW